MKKTKNKATIPWPKKKLLHKQVSHDSLDFTKARREGCGLVRKGLDEPSLVFLPIKS